MKKLSAVAVLSFFVLLCQLAGWAQSSPNLENGFKAFGSYDSSHLDTVNLMNGNLMLHVPVLPAYPQRGNFSPQYSLYVSSKGWQVHSKRTSSTDSLSTFWWQSNAPGVMVISNTGVLVHRSLLKTFVGNGNTLFSTQEYVLTGPDSASHKFNPVPGSPVAPNSDPTTYESVDGSGYHLVLSNADVNGLMSAITITDRNGAQYQAAFSTDYSDFQTRCMRPGIFGLPKVGNYAPFEEDAPFGDQVCPQYAFSQTATDSNGNYLNFSSTGPQSPPVPSNDTLARNMPFSFTPTSPGVPDNSKCVIRGGQALAATDLVYYNAPDGSVRSLQRCYATFPVQTAFGAQANNGVNMVAVAEAPSALGGTPTTNLLVTLIQADGTKWIFDYDSYANLTYVGLPTGGSIGYTWTTINLPACSSDLTYLGRAVQTRTLTDNNGHSSQWNYNWGAPGATITNTATDPAGNATVHLFSLQSDFCSFYETTTQYFQGPAAGQPLKQVDTTYSTNVIYTLDAKVGNVVPISIKTTVNPSGKVSLVTKQYDAGFGAGSPIFANVVKEFEYDWGPGPSAGSLLRETDTTYQWQVDSRYLAAHLVDLPASVVVKDSSGCALSETDYTYDEPLYLTGTTISTQHGAAPNPSPIRGNATTVTHWAAPTASCNPKSGTAITTRANWYDTGEPHLKIDPLGHTTTLTYDPFYVGAYVTQTCSPQTGSVTHCVSGTYDFNTGALTSLTNENATTQASGNTPGDDPHTTRFTYDYMFHIASAQAPPDPANGNAHANTSFSYSTMITPGAFPVTITRQKSITTALTDSATNTFDGLARPIIGQHAMPSGPASTVNTSYDDLHNTVTVTNPFFSTADTTYGTTTTQSDALGRALTVTEQDGSVKSVAYDTVAPASTLGDCSFSKDEAGNQRRSCSDALGRLVEVDEPNPGAPATFAQGSVTINGTEQSNTLSGASGSGAVTISGSEGTSQVCTDPEPPQHPVCHTIPDAGTIGIQFGTYAALYVNYGSGSTGATLASAVQQGYQNDPSSPVYAAIDPNNNTRVTFTARTIGLATNYAITYYNGADFTVGGLAALSGGRDASSSPDTGTVSVTVNGTSYSTSYGGSDTSATIASRIASSISAGSLANATASGNVITLSAKSAGQGGDYQLTAAATYDSAHFSGPSFTPSPANNSMANGYSVGDVDNQPLRTLYFYDALGNLLCVEQHGNVSGTGCSASPTSDASSPWRVRRFTYNSLSQLLTAHNPESGTITYSYDLDGNLLQKTSPAPNQTGSATQIISYCYDELHRVTGKAYSAQTCPLSSPVVTYAYDSGSNAKGKLTSLLDQAGTATYAYDPLGRMATETRVIAGVSKQFSYEYNLDGSLSKLHYPSGRVITYAPDSAGHIVSAADSNGTTYASGVTYYANGAEYQRHQPVVFFSTTLNSRLQVAAVYSNNGQPGPAFINKTYNYGTALHNNGNISSIVANEDSTRTQTFTYDPLNRIASGYSGANTGTYSWGENYSIDAWGNLNIAPMGGKAHGGTFANASDNYNRPLGFNFDSAGNLTNTTQYVYDPENRIQSTAGTAYTYDADGQRVLKSNSSTGAALKRYWMGNGNVLAEGDGSGNLTAEYVFFGGKRLVRIDLPSNTVHYYLSDHLGSTSKVVNSAGVVEEESDFTPYGYELTAAQGTNHYKFTSKERDSETQLDYFGARYYSNLMGRFMTPDWAAKATAVPYANFGDPQSLNLYVYVGNNPLNKTDIDGHVAQDQKDKKLPAPDKQHDHTITVREVSGQGPNVAGHVTVQIDGGREVGYGPAQDMTVEQAVKNTPVPGTVEPRAPNVKTEDQVTIHVTATQAKAAQQTITDTAKNPGTYVLHGAASNNCANFAERVVNSAGGSAPHDTTPGQLVKDLRNQQYKDNSVQTPTPH